MLILPGSWNYSVGTSSIISSLTCGMVTNLNSISCTSTQSSNIQITILNAFAQNNSNPFSFNISTVTSIPVSYSSTEITLETMSSTSQIIDTGTCTIQTPNPQTTAFTSSNTPNVATQFNFATTTTLRSKITQYDTISIVFPISVAATFTPSISFSSSSNCTFAFTLASVYVNDTSNSTLRNITYNLTDTRAASVLNCNQSNITISGLLLTLPSSLSNTFTFYFSRKGYTYSTGSYNLIATPNLLNTNTLLLTSNTTIINTQALFTISFVTISSLPIGSSIVLTLPSTMPTSSTICSNGRLNSTAFTPSCNVLSFYNLTLSIGSVIPSGTTVSFSFTASNPPSTETVSFSLATTHTDGGTVDYLNNILYTATADSILSSQVTSTSYTNGNTANYTVSFLNKNTILSNSLVLIGLPIGITFNTTTITCTYTLNGSSSGTINFTKVTSTGTVYNDGVNISLNNAASIPAGSNLSLTIGLINNPISTQPSQSFSIYVSTSNNYLIENGLSGIIIMMINPSAFISSSILSGSYVNG